jgi:hypothetical protein
MINPYKTSPIVIPNGLTIEYTKKSTLSVKRVDFFIVVIGFYS